MTKREVWWFLLRKTPKHAEQIHSYAFIGNEMEDEEMEIRVSTGLISPYKHERSWGSAACRRTRTPPTPPWRSSRSYRHLHPGYSALPGSHRQRRNWALHNQNQSQLSIVIVGSFIYCFYYYSELAFISVFVLILV